MHPELVRSANCGPEALTVEVATLRFLVKQLPIMTPSGSWQLLALRHITLLRDDKHCAELVPANVIKAEVNGQFQRAHQIESTPDEMSSPFSAH